MIKKIYIVTPALPSRVAPGAGLVAYNIARYSQTYTRIVAMQGDADGLNFPPHVEHRLFPVKRAPMSAKIKEQLYSESIGVVSKWFSYIYTASASGMVVFLVRVVVDLIRFAPDILVAHSLVTLPVGLFSKLFLRKKFILWLHNTTEAILISRHSLLLRLVSQADLIICISSDVQKHLIEVDSDLRTKVITTGVDLAQFRDYSIFRKKQIITVGSFKWKKGYHVLLAAAAEFLSRLPEYKLVIVGEGPLRGDIIAQIKQFNLEKRIELSGVLEQDQLVQLLNSSHLFILASLYEGFPKAMLEALACGTPVVVTDACNADEYLDGAGEIVPSGNSQSLAQAVIEILSSSDDAWRNRSKCAVQIASNFDWRLIGSAAWACYQSVCAE